MTLWRLIYRSLQYHRRTHLGVSLGAAVATAVLVGAMIVGDSVRHSLRQIALARLGSTHLAIDGGERYFTQRLAEAVASDLQQPAAALLDLGGICSAPGSQGGRANGIHVLGVDDRFWKLAGIAPLLPGAGDGDRAVINRRLADHLQVKVEDRIILRVGKPSALPRDVPLGSQIDDSITLLMSVHAIADDSQFGRYGLKADQIPPFNAFVPLALLQKKTLLSGKVNTLLIGGGVAPAVAQAAVARHWKLADAEVEIRALSKLNVVELRSTRVFLEAGVVQAAQAAAAGTRPILTYFVNELAHGGKTVPYSIVSSRDDLPADRVIINQWLADALGAKIGDSLKLTYFVLGASRRLDEQSSTFTIQAIEPTEGPGGDRELLPQFPGLADVDSSRDWKPGIPVDLTKIKDPDEDYWKTRRGTPKAFVPLEWARKTWGNRYGDLTSLRWPGSASPTELETSIRSKLDPAAFGLRFQPVRAAALSAAESGQDFGQLFIGLSFFLIVAALLLTGLLFLFGIERRASEIGTLLALGYTPGLVGRLLLGEGAALAAIGGILGVFGGIGYTQAVLWALRTMWLGAVGTSTLVYHAEPGTILGGWIAGVFTAVLAMFWAMRKMNRQPARQLLASRLGQAPVAGPSGRWMMIGGIACILAASGLMIAAPAQAAAGAFFGAGSLLLIGSILLTRRALSNAGDAAGILTLGKLAWRNAGRRAGRSLATVAMLACGAFLVVAINAFRTDAESTGERSSGSGGFELFGTTTLPVFYDLNSPEGREQFGLTESQMKEVSILQLRLKEGDEASCLNLNKPQTPPLLGVDPRKLDALGAFTFVKGPREHPWLALTAEGDEIPAVIDDNVAMWVLHKGVGDTIDFTDERGKAVKLKIVGTVAGSILQGFVIIDDRRLQSMHPSLAGSRVLLIDAPPEKSAETAGILERRLADVGLTTMRSTERLARFKSVEHTYLSIFSVLGGLGLILGVIGLGLVVMRNVLERRSELALMRAVGYPTALLRSLVLREHAGLLAIGLLIGVIAALAAIAPALIRPGAAPPVGLLAALLAITLGCGLGCTALSTRSALSGKLTDALREE